MVYRIWSLTFFMLLFCLQFFSSVSANVIPPQNHVLSYPLVAMPEEYINYTICLVDGRVWAKVDGTYFMQKIFGAGEEFCFGGYGYVVLSDELPLVYPIPPGTTNISVKIDGVELSWSNYTEANPQSLHYTVLGNWPMIYCKINYTPKRFTLKIHYEHPVEIVNGSHIFLYDLNISPYLTPWSNISTAYFNIRMDVRYSNLKVYKTGADGVWRPISYTLVEEDSADVIAFQIVSEYSKPLHGDIVVKFTVAEKSNSSTEHFWAAIAIVIFVGGALTVYMSIRRKMSDGGNKMKNRLFSLVLGGLILMSIFIFCNFISVIKANFFPIQVPEPAITIASNGSIIPSTAPILRTENKYILTGDVVGYTIVVERDNIVLDGNGYTLMGNGNSDGIFLINRKNVTVKNFQIKNFTVGIRLDADIYFGMSSHGNVVSGNVLTENEYGVQIGASYNNLFRNNQLYGNKYNFDVSGSPIYVVNDVDSSNTVDGKPIYYWINQHDKTVPLDAGYVALINCSNITVKNLNITNNGQGILLVYTNNSLIVNNTLTSNGNGIWLMESSNNTITGNKITLSRYDAIFIVKNSNNNFISANVLEENGHGGYQSSEVLWRYGCTGVRIGQSSKNIISQNRIARNGEGVSLQGPSSNNYVNANMIIQNRGIAVYLFNSRMVNISENIIKGNGDWGIMLWSNSSRNKVSQNHVVENGAGILIKDSQYNMVINNMVAENNGWGIQIKSEGFTSLSSRDNIIHHNNFMDNKVGEGYLQVSIPGTWGMGGWIPGLGNVWDDGEEGNFWGDYTTRYPNATEIDATGVWNTPYYINENNIDHYPLVNPVKILATETSEQTSENVETPPPQQESVEGSSNPENCLTTILIIVAAILVIGSLLVYLRKHRASKSSQ